MDAEAIQLMAEDMARLHDFLFAAAQGATLTAPAARHSAHIGVEHFASKMAELVADMVGSPYAQLFHPRKTTAKGHHPRREKGEVVVIEKAIPSSKRVIVLDDLATSAQTLEEHVKALQAIGVSVSAAVWVYGSTSGVGRG